MTNARELKAKIMRALGNYSIVHQDLMNIYGLSRPEARHAVSQLERLLWGRSQTDVAIRIDSFNLWKGDFGRQLQTIYRARAESKLRANTPNIDSWVSVTKEDYATMKAAWQRLDQKRRERLWPRMVFSALTSSPGMLPTFVQATFDHNWCPSHLLEDVVYLLFRIIEPAQSLEREREVAELVLFLLDHCPSRYMTFDQNVLHKSIMVLKLDELVKFYEALKRTEHPVHINTLQHITSRFAKSSAHKIHAVDVICALSEIPGFNINLPAPASVCTSLLTLGESPPFPEGQAEPDELLKVLLERGFRPNLLALTALMRNFCVRGRLDTAWKIFDLLLQHRFEPDAHVFSILLNASKKSFDIPSIRKIIEIVFSRKAWSQVIVNDFLDLMFRYNEAQHERRRRQKKFNNAWRPMLQLYAKFYDLAPLQKFFTFPLENVIGKKGVHPNHATPVTDLADAFRPQPEHMLFKPTSYTVLLLLSAHIRSIGSPHIIIRLYRYFCRLVNKGTPAALRLITDHKTMIYDIYLRALMQFRESLQTPMGIICHMMTNAEREKRLTGENIRHPFPSVYTWTILLNGFKNHGHTDGALHVLNMMTRIGNFQPNLVTWNALINAFTRVGDVHGAVRAMRLLEQAGISPDDCTMEAFSLLPRERREEAIRLLEQSREEPLDLRDPGAVLEGQAAQPRLRLASRWPQRVSTNPLSSDRPLLNPRPAPGPELSLKLSQQLAKARWQWDRHVRELEQRRQFPMTQGRNVPTRLNDKTPLGALTGHPSPRLGSMRHMT